MPKKSITIFCSHFAPHVGGIERFAELQATEFVRLGFTVNIITHDTERLGFLEDRGDIRIYRLRCLQLLKSGRLPLPISASELRTVYKLYHSNVTSLNIVHARYYPLSIVGCLFARLSRTPVVLLDHSSDYIQLGNGALNAIARAYEHLNTRIIMLFKPQVFGVAAACNRWLERFSIKAAGIYYNGVDTERPEASIGDIRAIHGIKGQRILLAVGRLIREKGVGELVKSFEHFAHTNDNYRLIIIGNGELEHEIYEATKRSPSIIFLGKQPADVVLAYMKQADVFINPSNYPEGLPTILLEAGRYGKFVISTPNGGASEVIKDGETGMLIERGDATILLTALKQLDERFDEGQDMGARLMRLIHSTFSIKETTRSFIVDQMQMTP